MDVSWNPAEEKPGVPYTFPSAFTSYFRKQYKTAAIYRWHVIPSVAGQPDSVYIGEADDLHRRVQRVLTPSKKEKTGDTNLRLNQLFRAFVAQGATVRLETATFDDFEINGIPFSPSTVGNQFVRYAVESILVRLALAERHKGPKVLNKRFSERLEKRIRSELSGLSPQDAVNKLQDAWNMLSEEEREQVTRETNRISNGSRKEAMP
jgi:hypothetical protein